MARRNLFNRNLFIIAALVVGTAALLGWMLASGRGLPDPSVAEVGVAPAPEPEPARADGKAVTPG